MRAIYKYRIPTALGSIEEVEMPIGAKIVHFAAVNGEFSVWAEVDTEAPTTSRLFTIIGTGHKAPLNADHIGTTIEGPFVRHLFGF